MREALLLGDAEEAGSMIPDELLDKFAVAGDPASVADHSAELFDAGAMRASRATMDQVIARLHAIQRRLILCENQPVAGTDVHGR